MKAKTLKETAEEILLIGHTMCDDTDARMQDRAMAMKLIQEYTMSNCDCTEEEITGHIIRSVCNNCGRVEG